MNRARNKAKKSREPQDATDIVLRRLARAPESAHQIYELAESLYLQREEGRAACMSLADIERVGEYLREIDEDAKRMKKQFADLATAPGSFQPKSIPVGF
jgi:HPt (histidine-containing phosphotransfer) domain-containing protein